jgi:hypothetical protein
MISTDVMPAEPSPSEGSMGFNFKQLVPSRERYLISWNPNILFVMDTRKMRLGGWCVCVPRA